MERKDWKGQYKMVKLNEVCRASSSNIILKNIKEKTGDYPVYGASGYIQNIDSYHCNEPYIGIIKDGAGVGKVEIYPAYSSLLGTMQYIHASEKVDLRYIYYKLRSLDFTQYINGAAIPHIYFKDYGQEIIPVPPLPVQARIVDELDCLQGILSKKRQQLAEYHSLAQAIFHQMFGDPVVNEKGWEVKKWKELFDTKLGKMLDRSQHTSSQKQYPYLANTNVQWGYFDLSDLRTMPFSDEELIKYDLEENDLLICEGGESGRCAIWHNKYSNQNILFQKAIHRARIKKANTVDITYISYFIRYSKELGGLKDYISKSTIEHLTGEKLKSLPIPLPPLPLQQSFAARIAAIDSQRERLAASIRELETLFACRMETLLNCPQA